MIDENSGRLIDFASFPYTPGRSGGGELPHGASHTGNGFAVVRFIQPDDEAVELAVSLTRAAIFAIIALIVLFIDKAYSQEEPGWFRSPQSYGARCDNITDDFDALQRWAKDLTSFSHGVVHGLCLTSQPLTFQPNNNVSLTGDGSASTALIYIGKNTTVDIFTFGDGVKEFNLWSISGLKFSSNTIMTAGATVRFRNMVESSMFDIIVGGQVSGSTLWHGLWFDRIDRIYLSHFDLRAQKDALRINGTVGNGAKGDLFLNDGKISLSDVGIRIGGAFGGFYAGNFNVIANNRNVVVDTTLAAEGNRELFFSPLAIIDSSATSCNIQISDTLQGTAGWINFDGPWIASSATHAVCIDAGVNYIVNFIGGTIFNNQIDGINNASTTATINIVGTVIRNNGASGAGFGLNSSVANSKITLSNVKWISNSSGNMNGLGSGCLTIATLPQGRAGDRNCVSDQLTACPSLGGTFTSGGSLTCSAFFNGSAWVHE